MALVDEFRIWFERDIRFATWDENVRIDEIGPDKMEVRFYTDANEYVVSIFTGPGGEPNIDAIVRARKPRAGQTTTRSRRLLPAGAAKLDLRAWRRILGAIIGLELVRVQRREAADVANEPHQAIPEGFPRVNAVMGSRT